MAENIFIDGMSFNKPREKAPDFVKGHISVDLKRFQAFAEKHVSPTGWINIDLKKSSKGNLYLSLNQYHKEATQEAPTEDNF